jgi:hypothetical protein
MLINSAHLVGVLGDFVMTVGLGTVSGGHIFIVDNNKVEHDRVGWGTAVSPETQAIIIGQDNINHVLERKQSSPGAYIDTNNNFNDFSDSDLRTKYGIGSIDEVIDVCQNIAGIQVLIPGGYYRDIGGNCVPIPVDICHNIDGIQISIPPGYVVDNYGNCQVDQCLNISGIQQIMPDGMDLDDSGNCVVHDECSNLPDIQADIPSGFIRGDNNSCVLSSLPLQVTELLPNAFGSDDGNEFIEIYNPNDSGISLLHFFLYIGSDYTHFYSFPVGSHIGAGQYLAFSNDDIKFTLVNTTSSVRLWAIDGTFFDTPAYDNPKDGIAWALIDDVWQYTNQPTPGSANLKTLLNEDYVTVDSRLEPCGSNQYRSPDTNRCRLITTSSSELTPCKDGQYRSEETNRCRSIASDANILVPCAEGQERSPDTNRCRSITAVLGASDLAPCKTGQERNPDTNRCRNIVSTIPKADYAPKQTASNSNNYIIWLSLAVVGMVAVGYGVWEWRQEINNGRLKLLSFLKHRK